MSGSDLGDARLELGERPQLRHFLDVRPEPEQGRQTGPEELMVVDDQDA